MLAGQVITATGVLTLTYVALDRPSIGLLWLMLAVASTLGGIVLTGASKRSTDDLQWALMKAQADRTQAIDTLALRDVIESEAKITDKDTG